MYLFLPWWMVDKNMLRACQVELKKGRDDCCLFKHQNLQAKQHVAVNICATYPKQPNNMSTLLQPGQDKPGLPGHRRGGGVRLPPPAPRPSHRRRRGKARAGIRLGTKYLRDDIPWGQYFGTTNLEQIQILGQLKYSQIFLFIQTFSKSCKKTINSKFKTIKRPLFRFFYIYRFSTVFCRGNKKKLRFHFYF